MADPHLLLLAGAVPVAGDRVPGTAEADEALAVDVQEIPRARPFVQPRPLARLPGRPRDPGPPERPPDGRVWMTELARDQPRSPAGATAGSADPLLLDRRQKPRRAAWSGRAILETAKRPPLLERRLRPAPPPLTSCGRRDATAPRRLTTRKAAFDIADQHPPTSESETRVTVKPHPGPSFDCEPSQTHSLEGGPDVLLSRPQPAEARHLDRGGSCAPVTSHEHDAANSKHHCNEGGSRTDP